MNSDLDGLAGRLDLWSAGAMSDSVPAQHVEAWYGCVIAAAIQIGWRNGYSRLPVKFRGNEQAQEAVDRKAMAHAWAWDCKGGPPPRPLHEEEWASQLVELPTVSHDHEQAPEP